MIKRVNILIEVTTFIFIMYMGITYVGTMIEYLNGLRPEFIDFTIFDKAWFIADKLIIFSLYFSIYFYVKNFSDNIILPYEVLTCTFFAFMQLVWQIIEAINFYTANNQYMQLALALISVGVFGFWVHCKFTFPILFRRLQT